MPLTVIALHLQDPEGKYEALTKYARDLTAAARDGKLDPVIGRDDEIRRCIQILSRRTKNNPVLIGEPGVGKTAVAEGASPSAAGSLLALLIKRLCFGCLSICCVQCRKFLPTGTRKVFLVCTRPTGVCTGLAQRLGMADVLYPLQEPVNDRTLAPAQV